MYRLYYNIWLRVFTALALLILITIITSLIFYKLNKRIILLEQTIHNNTLANEPIVQNIPNILEGDKYIDLYQKSIAEHMLFDFHTFTLDKNFAYLSNEDLNKLEQICTFKIGQERDKIYLSKAYNCLAKINQLRYDKKDQVLKSIKNISQALEISYLPEHIALLSKSLIIGFENNIPEKFHDLSKFFTGYKKDEIAILNELVSLNIPEITSRVNYRLAMIHLLGRASNKEHADPNLRLAIEEIKQAVDIANIKSDNIMDVVLTINNKELDGTLLTMVSALINADPSTFYRFHIINTDTERLNNDVVNKLESMKWIRDYNLSIINLPKENDFAKNISTLLSDIKLVNNDTNIYKLYLDKILPNLDTVLYLDSNSLVLKDLTFFKQLDIKNYFVAATIDLNNMLMQRNLCHDVRDFYINSGVVYFNLNKIRQESNLIKISDTQNCDFAYPEQDMLNLLFENHVYYVSPRWNSASTIFSNQQNTNETFSFIKNYHKQNLVFTERDKQIFKKTLDKLSPEQLSILRYQEIANYTQP